MAADKTAPDRKEMARDLFREHLDLDRLSRLLGARRTKRTEPPAKPATPKIAD